MKILMTADTVGGVWTYALELARALAPDGVKFTIATMGKPLTDAQRRDIRGVNNVEVVESTYCLEWMADPWSDVDAAGDWLLDLATEMRPDLVHLNGYTHAALDWEVPTCVVAHSCVMSWWRAVKGHAAPDEWSRYHRSVSAGLHAADLVIAPTRAMLDALEREYGHVPGARVVYNGRNIESFPAAPKEPLVLSAGRLWDEAKNVAAVLAVAPMLEWPVFIAGEAEPPRDRPRSTPAPTPTPASTPTPISTTASARQGGDRRSPLQHLGRLDSTTLRTWMARASIYALPATYEPFGLSVLEAGLAGCALVLGDIPSLRELWDGAAIFVAPNDTNALLSQLHTLIADESLRARVAAACQSRAQEFSVERMADGYMGAYRDMLHAARSASRSVACA